MKKKTVYVVFVKLAAYDGEQKSNPFNFEEIPLLEASLAAGRRLWHYLGRLSTLLRVSVACSSQFPSYASASQSNLSEKVL